MDLKGKWIVVTGGARRVGRAIVEELANAGAQPVIHYYQSKNEARALANKLNGVAIQADLSLPDGWKKLISQLDFIDKKLAVWVNNAASFTKVPFIKSDRDLWTKTLQLNLISPVSCCQWAAKHMFRGGVIVNILDVAAYQAWKGYSHHCVSKAALEMLTRTLAVELAPKIRVCGIVPGPVLFPKTISKQQKQRIIERIPLKDQGQPQDVAKAVKYAVDANYLTGSVITIDGGLMATSFQRR